MATVSIEHRRDTRPDHEEESGYYVVVRDSDGKETEAHGPMDFGAANRYRDYRLHFPLKDPRD